MLRFFFTRKVLSEEELFRARAIHLIENLHLELKDLGTFTQKLSDKIDNFNKDIPAKKYRFSDMDSGKS